MQEDANTPTENQVNGENEQNMSKTQGELQADAGQRPALYGRKVLSFVRRSARLDARLQRAWDTYADTYLLNINAGEGSLDVRNDLVFDQPYIAEAWGNANPLIVEIGTGQGENVVAAAAEHPEMNFWRSKSTIRVWRTPCCLRANKALLICASHRSTLPNSSRPPQMARSQKCGLLP